MKLQSSFLVFAIAALIAPAAVAGQQDMEMKWGKKVRPAPVGDSLLADGVVLADAGSAVAPSLTSQQKYDAAFSVCEAVVPVGHRDFDLVNGVGPSSSILGYFMTRGESYDTKTWKKTLVESPQHGKLIQQPNAGYVYYPNGGYLGPDQLTWVVEAEGKTFKVIETVWVANTAPEYGGCPADYKLPPATTGNEKRSALGK